LSTCVAVNSFFLSPLAPRVYNSFGAKSLITRRVQVSLYSSNSGDGKNEEDESMLPDRLAASYRSDNGTRDAEFNLEPLRNETSVSSLSTSVSNPFVRVVANLSPSDLIGRFMSTAHPKVQEAVRNTILGLIGSLPKLAFETTTITTGERLASLMFQLQMTGYMFKNAEYRMSLSQSLKGVDSTPMLSGSGPTEAKIPKVTGKIKVKYPISGAGGGVDDDGEEEGKGGKEINPEAEGMEIEVEAEAYMSELRSEVEKLRGELMKTREAKEEAVQKDMLAYIRSLPEQQMRELTGTITPDVLDAMKQLVDTVLGGIGEGEIGPATITEQSGSAMAQLCMWQLVVGYNLRELEVREEMEKRLGGGDDDE